MSTPCDDIIAQKLHHAWQQERLIAHVHGASRFATCLAVLITAGFLLDWGALARAGSRFPFGLLLSLVILAVLAAVFLLAWLRTLKPYDPLRTALAVEKRLPELSSLLVSYLQFEGPQSLAPNVSSELVAATRRRALELARPLDFRDPAAIRELRRPLGTAAAALLLCAVLGIGWSEQSKTFAARLAGSNALYSESDRPDASESPTVSRIRVSGRGDGTTSTPAPLLRTRFQSIIERQEALLEATRQLAQTDNSNAPDSEWERIAREQQDLIGSYGRCFETLVATRTETGSDREAGRLAQSEQALFESQPVIGLIDALQHLSQRQAIRASQSQAQAVASLRRAERLLAGNDASAVWENPNPARGELEAVPPEYHRHVSRYLEAIGEAAD